jgi:hypothetical protein
MQDHLDRELDVPTLARHAGYSERSFYRKFTDATGKTPAHFVEDCGSTPRARCCPKAGAQDHRRPSRAQVIGPAGAGIRAPLRHGAVAVPPDARVGTSHDFPRRWEASDTMA